ncbi:MAG: 2-C-methyl-D-erythritol 2,4-cyclodiphosphate synthase [Brevinemataceae bacterium]
MYRVSLGYDLHRLKQQENGNVFCGGISIPCDLIVDGAHSDGDVLLHALTDAFLSLCCTDIGIEFPNTDPKNKNRPSIEFLKYALDKIYQDFKPINIDIVMICDYPKIGKYAPIIRQNLSSIIGISDQVISVRGKTTEDTKPLIIEAYVNMLVQKI